MTRRRENVFKNLMDGRFLVSKEFIVKVVGYNAYEIINKICVNLMGEKKK